MLNNSSGFPKSMDDYAHSEVCFILNKAEREKQVGDKKWLGYQLCDILVAVGMESWVAALTLS